VEKPDISAAALRPFVLVAERLKHPLLADAIQRAVNTIEALESKLQDASFETRED